MNPPDLTRDLEPACPHNCDEGGICLAELSGYPGSCPRAQATEGKWLLIKRGLYKRPGHMGYTGILENAGLYSEQEAKDSVKDGSYGVSMIRYEDAPEFTDACFDDLARKHLQDKITALKAALRRALSEPAAPAGAEPLDGPEEIEIDRLRLAAFKTPSNENKAAYYLAVSKWFQDRHYRRLAHPAPADKGVVEGWRTDMDSAPKDGTVVNVVGRYRSATAGFPRYAAFVDGQWVEYSRRAPEPIVVWAWRPRDEWPMEPAAALSSKESELE